MYYESRSLTSLVVADARAAVILIHERKLGSHQAAIWINKNGQRVALVDDSHIDSAFLEVALINIDTKEQYDSITFGWCKSLEEKLQYVTGYEDGHQILRTGIHIALDGAGEDQKTNFECSCCGEGFQSTIARQKKFDQDHGYGYCPSCIRSLTTA